MSIKPAIKCPPDYSILNFRLIECKKAGIVKGITTQLAVDLQDLFVPVTNYEERMLTLKSGETRKIDVSSIGTKWQLEESYTFTVNPEFCGLGTEHSYSLYDDNLNLIDSITFEVNDTYPTFKLALANAALNSEKIDTHVSVGANSKFSTNGIIEASAKTKGVKYRHLFALDITGFGGYSIYPYLHPGNLDVPFEKYKTNRIKIMMLWPQYSKANVYAGCNCIDRSGDLKSNVKYIEYAFEEDYDKTTNVLTPITINPKGLGPTNTFTWNQNDSSHFDYYFKVGDLIASKTNPSLRGYIVDINGFDITLDTTIGDGSENQSVVNVWAPSQPTWRKIGDFYLHTAAQDVTDSDNLFIESVYLKNTQSFDLPVRMIIAS
jgi:hypothetical protein